jgi:hypothetical protein
MPPGVESFSLVYRYERRHEAEGSLEAGKFTSREEINIIDLGLISLDGKQVGVSGSDKTEIHISETVATPGYHPCPLIPGEWGILIGAYKVAPSGVTVTYELTFTFKHLRLLKGDLHTHTIGSDGVLTAEELARHAQRNGMDYLALTDHNQMVSAESLPDVPGFTLIPGIEWTHYQGHANFLGVDRPYDEPFYANTPQEVQARFASARERGALIVINHPFDEGCPFLFDMDSLPYDCIEIWNGPMRESNIRSIALWSMQLMAGKKIPICGGSDYHRDMLFLYPGGPCTCIYSMSNSAVDILSALKAGHAYVTFAPNGPSLEMTAGEAILGDSVPFSRVKELQISVTGLNAGDVIQLFTNNDIVTLLKAENPGNARLNYRMTAPGFARLQILRSFIPGMPMLPALVSNPIYFDQ